MTLVPPPGSLERRRGMVCARLGTPEGIRSTSGDLSSRSPSVRGDHVATARDSVAVASRSVTSERDAGAGGIRSVTSASGTKTSTSRSRTIGSHSMPAPSGRETLRRAHRTAATHVDTLPSRASSRPLRPIQIFIRLISVRTGAISVHTRKTPLRGQAIPTGGRLISLRVRRKTVASAESTARGHAISIA